VICGKFLDIPEKWAEKLVLTYQIGTIDRKIASIPRSRVIARKVLAIHPNLSSYPKKIGIIYLLTISGKVLDIMTKLPVILYLTRLLGVIYGNFRVNK
jgi:hypothetical protein